MRVFLHGAAVTAFCLLAACSEPTKEPSVTTTSEGDLTAAPPGKVAAQENVALVRFINADSEERSATIFAGDNKVYSDISYKGITAYTAVDRGYTQFKLRSGSGSEDLASTRRELFPGRHYTVIALPRRDGKSRLVSVSDNLSALDPGEARLRVINATKNVDDLALYEAGTNNRIVRAVDAGSFTTFTELQPGLVELRPKMDAPPMKLAMLPVQAGSLYTFIVIGEPNAEDLVQVEDRVER